MPAFDWIYEKMILLRSPIKGSQDSKGVLRKNLRD
jgi:hypothetical protein